MRLLSSCQLEAEASVIPEVTRREEFTSKFTLGACIQLGAETEFLPNMGPGFFKTIKPKYYIYIIILSMWIEGTVVYNLISWRYSITLATFYP